MKQSDQQSQFSNTSGMSREGIKLAKALSAVMSDKSQKSSQRSQSMGGSRYGGSRRSVAASEQSQLISEYYAPPSRASKKSIFNTASKKLSTVYSQKDDISQAASQVSNSTFRSKKSIPYQTRTSWRDTYYENQLLNTVGTNYGMSPAAKCALRDGSLDNSQTWMNKVTNRKLKMRDTFTKAIPTYNHGEGTGMRETVTHTLLRYKDTNSETGKPTHFIDRRNTHKQDVMIEYTEHMLKMPGFYDMKLPQAPKKL